MSAMPIRSFCLCAALVAGSAQAATLALTHARIHTLSPSGTLEDATLLLRDGVIEAIGTGIAVPDDAKVIDTKGAVITPGLFDAYTHIGLDEIDGVEETVDIGSNNPRYSAALDVVDGLNPRSVLVPVNRIEGLTQAMSAPASGPEGPLFAGRGAVINLGTLDAFVARPQAAMFLSLGEAGAARIKGGRPALLLALREALEEVKSLGSSNPVQRAAQLGALDAEALKPVLVGEMPLVAEVNRAADIRVLLQLAEDYGLKLILRGAAEAHLVAAELAARQVPVILDPTLNLPQNFEALAARADAAAILHKAGVRIAFSSEGSGYGSHNSRNLRQLAGNAVAHGLPWNAALAAITLNPAAIYGLDSTLGSLETGRQASFVVWDGDPLEVTSSAVQVFAAGRAVPMQSRQTLLRDRYQQRRQPAPPAAPAKRP
ncbi:MAG: amidohydrolase family protein [Pseudomonadota bacterium]